MTVGSASRVDEPAHNLAGIIDARGLEFRLREGCLCENCHCKLVKFLANQSREPRGRDFVKFKSKRGGAG